MVKESLLLSCIVLLFLFSFSGCSRKEKPKKINFSDTIELKENKSVRSGNINICVGSMITPEEGFVYYKSLLDYIEQKINMKVNFIEKRTYAEVNALLKNGNIDLAFVCGGPYVQGNDEFDLELLVAPQVNEETFYYSYIIVAKNKNINSLADLQGKVFAFADPLSNTGKLIPAYMLHKIGSTPDKYFKEYVYTYSHDKSIKAVAQNIVDGAAVDSLIWEYLNKNNSPYTKKTRIIKISAPYGIPPVVVSSAIDEKIKIKLKNIFLNMHNNKKGKQILKGMHIEKFKIVSDSIYESIRRIKSEIEK